MPSTVAHKLISSHLADGDMIAGTPIALRIDQTLTQDATGRVHLKVCSLMYAKKYEAGTWGYAARYSRSAGSFSGLIPPAVAASAQR